MTRHEVETALAGWRRADFPRWINALNRWQWPDECPLRCPAGFVAGSHAVKMQLARPLWDYLHRHTSQAAISRDLWLEHLGRTAAEWEAYWAETICDCPLCFSLPREQRGQHPCVSY